MFYFFSDGNLQLQEGILLFLFRVLSIYVKRSYEVGTHTLLSISSRVICWYAGGKFRLCFLKILCQASKTCNIHVLRVSTSQEKLFVLTVTILENERGTPFMFTVRVLEIKSTFHCPHLCD